MQNLQAINTSCLYKLSIQGRNKVYEIRDQRLRVSGGMVRGDVISKSEIKKCLEKQEEGKELLNKFTINQLVNRLKYERRLCKQT